MEEWRQSSWGSEITLEYEKAIRGYQEAIAPYRVYGTNGPVGWAEKPLAPGPGVILGRKGAYRGVNFSRDPFFVIDTAYYVKPKHDLLDMRWLYYAIIHHKLGEIDDGSPIPSTTRAAVYVRDFDVPPLSEQRAIAATLGALDDKIELNRRMCETLESMARALFRDWFVDFGPTRAKMAGTAPYLAADLWSLFPDRLDDEGKPEGWNETTIGNALERLKVGRLYDQKSALLTGIVPILDQGKSGSIGFHNNEPNIRADAESRVCTFSNHTCVLRLIDFDFSTIQNVIPFRGKGISTEWLYYASLGRQKFEEYRGHWPSFVEHKITAPPSKLANVFCDIVAPMVNAISQNGRESRTLAQTRDLLLPRLMSGELRIAEAERMLEEVA